MNIFETQLLANRVASQYLQHNEDLNSQIAKYASERDLSRIQIQGLVSAVNHVTNDQLRKSAEDKTYTFELADLDKVLGELDLVSEGFGVTKVAEAIRDLNVETGVGEALVKKAEFGSDMEQDRRRKEAILILEKVAAHSKSCLRQIEAKKYALMNKLGSAIEGLTQEVKEYMLRGGYAFEDIYKYASALPHEKQLIDTTLIKVAGNLEKLGHPFKGQLAKGKELVNESHQRAGAAVPPADVTIINGATPVAKYIDEINACVAGYTQKDLLTHEISSLNSYAVASIEDLSNNVAVHRHLLQDLDSFHRQFRLEPDMALEKAAGLVNALKGAKIVGKLSGQGAGALNKGLKAVTGKGAVRTAAGMAGAAAAGGAMGYALKGGQRVSEQARRGVSQSAGKGAADSDAIKLR